jgi:hypothetical protein
MIKVYSIIEDFNDLCEYEIIEQNDRSLKIKDLQCDMIIETSVLEWLEKIYDYYTTEILDQKDLWYDKHDLEWLIYYYDSVLETVKAIKKEKELYNA